LAQDAAKEKEIARQMMQTNARDAEKCIKKEREILRVSEMNSRRRKRWWLSYYKRAIHRLMALSWLKKSVDEQRVVASQGQHLPLLGTASWDGKFTHV
jgi:hypothetical protein